MRLRPWIGGLLAAALALVWWGARQRHAAAPPPRPPTAGERAAVVHPAPPPPTPTAAPLPEEVRRATFVVAWAAATPSPSPTSPVEEPTPRRGTSPTPNVAECVTAEASATTLAAAPGQVLVDIRAVNHCGRDLAALEVWFRVAGVRGGQLVQAVRGHPFDPIPRDGEAEVHIALPGSLDWYDEVEVRVLAPDAS